MAEEKSLKKIDGQYTDLIKERKRTSRVYRDFQAIGIEIAEILEDKGHTSLYIKLAKEDASHMLIALAKDVASRKDIKKKGAYFMSLLIKKRQEKKSLKSIKK